MSVGSMSPEHSETGKKYGWVANDQGWVSFIPIAPKSPADSRTESQPHTMQDSNMSAAVNTQSMRQDDMQSTSSGNNTQTSFTPQEHFEILMHLQAAQKNAIAKSTAKEENEKVVTDTRITNEGKSYDQLLVIPQTNKEREFADLVIDSHTDFSDWKLVEPSPIYKPATKQT